MGAGRGGGSPRAKGKNPFSQLVSDLKPKKSGQRAYEAVQTALASHPSYNGVEFSRREMNEISKALFSRNQRAFQLIDSGMPEVAPNAIGPKLKVQDFLAEQIEKSPLVRMTLEGIVAQRELAARRSMEPSLRGKAPRRGSRVSDAARKLIGKIPGYPARVRGDRFRHITVRPRSRRSGTFGLSRVSIPSSNNPNLRRRWR